VSTINTIELRDAPPEKISWRITSSPPGAEIIQRGEVRGKTPMTLMLNKDATVKATFKLRLDGHDEATIRLSGDESYDRTVTLVPRIAIAIESRPPGAEVF